MVNDDAMQWLTERTKATFDVVVVDFPDPNNVLAGQALHHSLLRPAQGSPHAQGGIAVIQSTSPLFARQSLLVHRRDAQGRRLHHRPYHAWVPSFGEWGYVLAAQGPLTPRHPLPDGLRFLSEDTLDTLYEFPKDMDQVPAEVNRLNNQVLVHSYEDEWRKWND